MASANGADRLASASALTDGYSAAFLGAAAIAVLGGAVAALTLGRPADAEPVPAEQSPPDQLVAV